MSVYHSKTESRSLLSFPENYNQLHVATCTLLKIGIFTVYVYMYMHVCNYMYVVYHFDSVVVHVSHRLDHLVVFLLFFFLKPQQMTYSICGKEHVPVSLRLVRPQLVLYAHLRCLLSLKQKDTYII